MEPTPKLLRIKERFEKRYRNMNEKQKKALSNKMELFIDDKMEAFNKNFIARNPNINQDNPTSAQRNQMEKALVRYFENTLAPKIGKMVRKAEREAIKGKPKFVQKNIKNKREQEKKERLKKKAGK